MSWIGCPDVTYAGPPTQDPDMVALAGLRGASSGYLIPGSGYENMPIIDGWEPTCKPALRFLDSEALQTSILGTLLGRNLAGERSVARGSVEGRPAFR